MNGITGREARRPGSAARLFFRPTLSFLGSFSLSADILISTEGKSSRQAINQLDFNPKWRWGSVHLGDFSESYSSMTLNGIRIRGASLSINPGKFRFSTIAGSSRRATTSNSSPRSYSREICGGKIGLGRESGSYIDLMVLRLRDRFASLPQLADTLNSQDSTAGINPLAVHPEENLIVAIASDWDLVKNKLSWNNELSGSAYTRNTQGSKLSAGKIPLSVEKIFKFRVGSRVDVAYKTELNTRFRNWSLSSGY